jgi:hypothetical protein
MLIVSVFSNGKSNTIAQWHIGEDTYELSNLADEWAGDRLVVQADGDELLHILNRFKGIPRCKDIVQRWYSSIACHIIGNL